MRKTVGIGLAVLALVAAGLLAARSLGSSHATPGRTTTDIVRTAIRPEP